MSQRSRREMRENPTEPPSVSGERPWRDVDVLQARIDTLTAALADYIDKLRGEADALTKKTMGYPIPATVHAARRIADDLSNLIPKEGE